MEKCTTQLINNLNSRKENEKSRTKTRFLPPARRTHCALSYKHTALVRRVRRLARQWQVFVHLRGFSTKRRPRHHVVFRGSKVGGSPRACFVTSRRVRGRGRWGENVRGTAGWALDVPNSLHDSTQHNWICKHLQYVTEKSLMWRF